MNKKIYILFLLATLLHVSCKDNEDTDAFTDAQCSIQSIKLGQLTRNVYTQTSTGKDTLVHINVKGWEYPISIDQLGKRIFNIDSLPPHTQLHKAVLLAFNSHSFFTTIRSLHTGKDTLFNVKDTIDLSQPRILTVWAKNGVAKCTYTLDIRAHQQKADSFQWHRLAIIPALKGLNNTRICVAQDQLQLFGTTAGKAVRWQSHKAHPEHFTDEVVASPINFSTLHYDGTHYYALQQERLYQSENGIQWQATATPQRFTALLFAHPKRIVALNADGIWVSNDQGTTFQQEQAADPHLPFENLYAIEQFKDINLNYREMLFGYRDTLPVMWLHDIDPQFTSKYPWVYAPINGALPRLLQPLIFTYDNQLILAGLSPKTNQLELYASGDQGLTWQTNTLTLPANFEAQNVAITTDADHFIYLISTQSGEIWRGRLNRLGWKKITTSFEY